ncbi:MAG: hypothetical protein E7249_20405 [Paenibacillaceae bacterium]|nr:hypothetical protein [Paenibacillaceae bacterium]
MESYNLIPLIIIILLLVLISFFIFIIKFIRSVKWGWLYLLIILAIIVGGVKLHNHFKNLVFYDFKTKICESYPEINTIDLYMSYGAHSGSVNVKMKNGTNDEVIEKIFLNILSEINSEPMSSYLKGSTNYDNKSWVILDIFFYGDNYHRYNSGPYQHSEWFTENNKIKQIWKNDATGKEYRYAELLSN